MARRKRVKLDLDALEGPTLGDFMVEPAGGDIKCFSGKTAHDEAMAYAQTFKYAEVFEYKGWERFATIDVEFEQRIRTEAKMRAEKRAAENKK